MLKNNYYFLKKIALKFGGVKYISYLCIKKRNKQTIKSKSIMKRFLINFKEVSYGVVEVFAETEEEARVLAEEYDDASTLIVNKSELKLGEVVEEEDIEFNL